eukprot:7291726-Prymnesium_polylepis.1
MGEVRGSLCCTWRSVFVLHLEVGRMTITYTLGRSLYITLTNRCNSVSLIESRGPGFAVPASSGFAPLREGFEPNAADILEAARDAATEHGAYESIVFAGAGEVSPVGLKRAILSDALF